MSIFIFKTFKDNPMFEWNEKSANGFSSRILAGEELTVTHKSSHYKGKCFLSMFKPNQTEVAYHWFEMALFVGLITCDSGGDLGRHYIFNDPKNN